MSDPERIWLQSYEDTTAVGEDRLWCEDKVWPECAEQQEPTEYIRADLYASRISQQDAELERLREALKPFALAATIFEQEYGDRMKSDTGCNIKFAVLCQARAALRAKAEETLT